MRKVLTIFCVLIVLLPGMIASPKVEAAGMTYDRAAKLVRWAEHHVPPLIREIRYKYRGNFDYPDKQIYLDARNTYMNAMRAINELPDSSRKDYLINRLEDYTGYYNLHAVYYKDAVNLGNYLQDKSEEMIRLFDEDATSDEAENLYHELSYQLRRNAPILFYRVWGAETRNGLIKEFVDPALLTSYKYAYPVITKMALDELVQMQAAQKPQIDIDAKKTEIRSYISEVEADFGPDHPVTKQFKAALDESAEFRIATFNSDGTFSLKPGGYDSLEKAKDQLKDSNTDVVLAKDKVLAMKDGVVYPNIPSNSTVTVYETEKLSGNTVTYVDFRSQMRYLDSNGDWIKVQVADKIGYVSKSIVELKPIVAATDRDYYINTNGTLKHVVDGYGVEFDKAPSFMEEGTKYYSWDSINYTDVSNNLVGTFLPYYQFLPAQAQTNYTADELYSYVTKNISTIQNFEDRYKACSSPLRNKEIFQAIVNAQENYGVNALFILSAAMHESAWGTSPISCSKYNLFGIGAFDSNPSDSATPFDGYVDSINTFAQKYMRDGYMDAKDWRYAGSYVGNKGSGFNVRYASDSEWGKGIAGYMYRIDRSLGFKDYNQYDVRRVNVEPIGPALNVRTMPTTSGNTPIYELPHGTSVIVLEKVNSDWYKIYADLPNVNTAYVHGGYLTKP